MQGMARQQGKERIGKQGKERHGKRIKEEKDMGRKARQG
jgi:hypothetical protein